MSILIIALFIFIIGLLMVTVGLVFSPYYYYAVLIFFFFCVFSLIEIALFRVHTRKYPRNALPDYQNKDLFIHFTSKKGKKKIKVVKQGVSEFNFISQGITEALFGVVSQRAYYGLKSVVLPMNETIFMEWNRR